MKPKWLLVAMICISIIIIFNAKLSSQESFSNNSQNNSTEDVSFEVHVTEVHVYTPEELKRALPIEDIIDFNYPSQVISKLPRTPKGENGFLANLKSSTKTVFTSEKKYHPARFKVSQSHIPEGYSIDTVPTERYTEYPERTIGALFYTAGLDQNGERKIGKCTAAAVASPGQNLLWTAGHCVSDGKGNQYKDWNFIPGYQPGDNVSGGYRVCAGRVNGSWHFREDWSQDFAALKACPIMTGERGQAWLHFVTGYLGFTTEIPADKPVVSYGYPKDLPPFDGEKMFYCSTRSKDNPLVPRTLTITCPMGKGASGGPWIINYSSDTWGEALNQVNGINSFVLPGYQGQVFSPYFGESATRLYNYVIAAGY